MTTKQQVTVSGLAGVPSLQVLRMVLEVGNLLNQGTNRTAMGFHITDLPKV